MTAQPRPWVDDRQRRRRVRDHLFQASLWPEPSRIGGDGVQEPGAVGEAQQIVQTPSPPVRVKAAPLVKSPSFGPLCHRDLTHPNPRVDAKQRVENTGTKHESHVASSELQWVQAISVHNDSQERSRDMTWNRHRDRWVDGRYAVPVKNPL